MTVSVLLRSLLSRFLQASLAAAFVLSMPIYPFVLLGIADSLVEQYQMYKLKEQLGSIAHPLDTQFVETATYIGTTGISNRASCVAIAGELRRHSGSRESVEAHYISVGVSYHFIEQEDLADFAFFTGLRFPSFEELKRISDTMAESLYLVYIRQSCSGLHWELFD